MVYWQKKSKHEIFSLILKKVKKKKQQLKCVFWVFISPISRGYFMIILVHNNQPKLMVQ